MRKDRRQNRRTSNEAAETRPTGGVAVLERSGWIDPVAHELRPNEPTKPPMPDGTTPLARDEHWIQRTQPVRQHR